jgi:isoleucyl-tRNA synthetase
LKAALEGLSGELAAAAGLAVEGGQSFELAVEGDTLRIEPEEVILETSAPTGYAVSEDAGVLVALDTTLTPELRLEGAARDLVRAVQDARKEAGLAISDRIRLYLAAEDGAAQTLADLAAAYGSTLQGETLATELHLAPAPQGAHTAQARLEDGFVQVGIIRQ